MKRKFLLAIEFLILFVGVPLFILFDKEIIHPSIIILPVLLFINVLLRYTTDFRLRELFRWEIPHSLLLKNLLIVLASGITFSFVNIVYYDPVSLILSFTGGIYFARVYQQTGSVLFTAVLHGLMGILIFGVGLGQYFWLDMPV